MNKTGVLFLFFVACNLLVAQDYVKPKLLAGPVVGSVTKNSARVWIAYRGKGQNMLILGDTAEKKVYYPSNVNYITNSKGDVALTMDFTGLKPDRCYNVLISIDGWGATAHYYFKTQADTAIKDFNFILGSCALQVPGIARLVFPAASDFIFFTDEEKEKRFYGLAGR